MKKIMLSMLFLAINAPLLAMDKAPAKSAEVAAAKKAGDEKKANDVTEAKTDKEVAKRHSLFSCLVCQSCKEK